MGKLKYTQAQVDILRATSMRDILAAEGYNTDHTRGGLYYSPFRGKENAPSLHIDDNLHKWFDHGNPTCGVDGRRGGDTVDFVRLLKGLSFLDALDYLCRFNPSVVPDIQVEAVKVPAVKDRIIGGGGTDDAYAGTEIAAVLDRFSDERLIRYAEGRGIPAATLNRYCREVHYTVTYRGKEGGERKATFRAIGFPNSGGGWMLRYLAAEGKRGKRSTGGGYTAIAPDGGVMAGENILPRSCSVLVFEGFMDFLSWAVQSRGGDEPRDTDIVVLNSISNARQALPFILSHANVITLMDNDEGGDQATEFLHDETVAAGRRFYDRRDRLGGYNDYNEMWQHRIAG